MMSNEDIYDLNQAWRRWAPCVVCFLLGVAAHWLWVSL